VKSDFEEISHGIMREVPARQLGAGKKTRVQIRREEINIVRARAIEGGLASVFNVNRVIYSMDARAFRELAHDFPALSRDYFHPSRQIRNKRLHNTPLTARLRILGQPNPVPALVLWGLIMVGIVYTIRAIWRH
jgi:hypothetical protein